METKTEAEHPKISVIMPVYNAMPYLKKSVDDVLGQSMREIELICVDDGSTDDSLAVLRAYEARDTRVRVLTQKNLFAGVARNLGIEHATGDYFMFLDADDLFEPTLIEQLYTACERSDAQMALCRSDIYDMENDRFIRNNPLPRALFPKPEVFSPCDYSDYLFQFVTPVPWAKIFRRDLIMEAGIRFEARRKTNDLYFAFCNSAIAESIVFVDQKLVHLRRGQIGNLQSQHSKDSYDFAGALLAVKNELVSRGIFEQFERSFVNAAVLESNFVCNALQGGEAYTRVVTRVREELLESFGVLGHEPRYFHSFLEYGALQWLLGPATDNVGQSFSRRMMYYFKTGVKVFGLPASIKTAVQYIQKKWIE